jgi:SAM-dependent methyltransferase
MGKKKGNKAAASTDDFLQTLEDFTSKENWDKFFTLRGNDDSFEWYAEWPQLHDSLLPLLQDSSSSSSDSLQILVPGCGNSRLTEHLYDAGFRDITNVDFSKVVISDMLRRNIRTRPELRWRVMDITKMQLADESFDTVLDKGALDALMEPEVGTKLGNQYLSEVLVNFFCLRDCINWMSVGSNNESYVL